MLIRNYWKVLRREVMQSDFSLKRITLAALWRTDLGDKDGSKTGRPFMEMIRAELCWWLRRGWEKRRRWKALWQSYLLVDWILSLTIYLGERVKNDVKIFSLRRQYNKVAFTQMGKNEDRPELGGERGDQVWAMLDLRCLLAPRWRRQVGRQL